MKGTNMKGTRSIDRATKPAKTVHLSPGEMTEGAKTEIELSPEMIAERAAAKTTLLTEILEREETAYAYRYWGINE
jgi:hypothetical protein